MYMQICAYTVPNVHTQGLENTAYGWELDCLAVN